MMTVACHRFAARCAVLTLIAAPAVGAFASPGDAATPTNAVPTVAEAEAEAPSGWNYAWGEGVSYGERQIVSAELSIAWDSKYMSYGLVDNNEPIITPAASLTFFDWFFVGVTAIFDTTKYGRGAGYYNRAWTWTELDPELGIAHSFTEDEWDWLPTTVDFSASWMYEHHPTSMLGPDGDFQDAEELDSQFVTVDISLPDLWIQPTFEIEQDIARDSGTYLNLELAHSFAIIDGDTEDGDPVLSLTPSVSQGWGDNRRVRGYLSHRHDDPDQGEPDWLNRAALMDSRIQLAADWNICAGLALSGYVAYTDYLFDRHVRDAARRYEATGRWDNSFNFVCGLRLTATF